MQETIGWGEDNTEKELKNTRVMEIFLEKSGSAVKGVNLSKGGNWVPQHVYFFKGRDYMLGVEGELEEL